MSFATVSCVTPSALAFSGITRASGCTPCVEQAPSPLRDLFLQTRPVSGISAVAPSAMQSEGMPRLGAPRARRGIVGAWRCCACACGAAPHAFQIRPVSGMLGSPASVPSAKDRASPRARSGTLRAWQLLGARSSVLGPCIATLLPAASRSRAPADSCWLRTWLRRWGVSPSWNAGTLRALQLLRGVSATVLRSLPPQPGEAVTAQSGYTKAALPLAPALRGVAETALLHAVGPLRPLAASPGAVVAATASCSQGPS
mmetsp:Transcript_59310/g.190825  ORF Transcript_59310/g.190825 Transcript_59310/m.190825 type:complete len:257 (-) Transcript_59310:102-872(-)